MKTICGVDIGNSTTEITIASIYKNKEIKFLGSSRVKTSGIKGTVENIIGIRVALKEALIKSNLSIKDINLIKINEASPVISENAMETISETIITNSAMIGHNPDTPAGQGVAIGETINIDCINYNYKKDYIVVIDETFNYDNAAYIINKLVHEGININGAILKADEAVLLYNRLNKKIPIIDEVKNINKVPLGMLAAIEVAKEGKTIKTLSNPYGIANIFSLTADETQKIIPLAKGLIGLRSGVIIKTPEGEVLEKKIKAGMLKIIGKKNNKEVDINEGALSIMKIVNKLDEIIDIEGEKSTNISAMINLIKTSMTDLSRVSREMVRIRDILALDTTVPIKIKGGIAEEVYREKAVAIAAMVKTNKLPLEEIKEKLIKEFKVEVKIEGIEAIMATLGALTTPGTKLPIAMVDIGGGSTDMALLEENGRITTLHLAGAGEMVTMLINLELNLNDRNLAEEIKKNIVGKVESLYSLRLETGELVFFKNPLDSKLYGRIVVVNEKKLIPIYSKITIENIVKVRKSIKEKVFVSNVIRGLKKISPMNNINFISNLVLVGGSALDFEIPDMLMKELSLYGIVAGCGNIRRKEGARHAVSTGLILNSI